MKRPELPPQMSVACDRVLVSQTKGNNKWIKCVFTARVFLQATQLFATTVMSMTE
jgi:hypothetical protein